MTFGFSVVSNCFPILYCSSQYPHCVFKANINMTSFSNARFFKCPVYSTSNSASGGPGLLDKILPGLSGFLRFRLLVG